MTFPERLAAWLKTHPHAFPLAALTVAAAVVFVLFISASATATGGHVVAPLDDSYIYFQYAKRLAQGHFYSYTGSDGYSTGVTSMLYPLLLAPFYLLGFTGEVFVAIVIALGGLLLAASGWLMYLLTRRATGHWAPALVAGLLVVLNGRVVWGYLSGMEIPLLITAVLATVWLWTTPGREGLAAAAACVLVLARPEGLVFGVVLAVLLGLRVLLEGHRPGGLLASFRGRTWRLALYALGPVAVGSVPFLLNLAMTGQTVTNTGVAHSQLYDPFVSLSIVLQRTAAHLHVFQARIMTGDLVPSSLAGVRQALAIVTLLGFIVLCVQELGRRTVGAGAIALGAGLTMLAAEATIIPSSVHHFRYYMPYIVLGVFGLMVGVYNVLSRIRWRPRILLLAPAVLLVTPVAALPDWATTYAANASDIRYQHIEMARVVNQRVPADALLGLNDVGAIAYFTDRSIFDVIGLTTNGVAEWSRHGEGTLWEMLERTPRRPDYLAVYPHWLRSFYETGTWRKLNSVRLEEASIAGEAQMDLLRPDWSLAGSGDRMRSAPAPGLSRVVDVVDVADLVSERQHVYRLLPRTDGVNIGNNVVRSPYVNGGDVMDGGRLALGGERMTVRVTPGAPLLIVRRSYSREAFRIRVRVNGQDAGVWSADASAPVPPEVAKALPWYADAQLPEARVPLALRYWSEDTFQVPSTLITAPDVEMEFILEMDGVRRNPFRYSAYHYWFLQP
ncbi:MAG: hypothetical protein Q7T26_01765 [Dehalococcoidia bacterium]|nr:hypothetical protein [Dehalococcoidia bacterium]